MQIPQPLGMKVKNRAIETMSGECYITQICYPQEVNMIN